MDQICMKSFMIGPLGESQPDRLLKFSRRTLSRQSRTETIDSATDDLTMQKVTIRVQSKS